MGHNFKLSDLGEINPHSVPLGEGIKGFVYISRKGIPHIFISDSLSPECTAETLAHELYHLNHDNVSHGIGLNRQHEEIERKADRFATLNYAQLQAIMTT